MRHILRTAILTVYCALGFAAIFPVGSASAADGDIQSSRFTFGNRVYNGYWSPLRSRVENRGSKTLNLGVVATVDVGGLGKEQVSFTRRVTVPPKCIRNVDGFILMDYPNEALVPLFEEKEREHSFSDGSTLKLVRHRPPHFQFRTSLVNLDTGEEFDKEEFPVIPTHPGAFNVCEVFAQPTNFQTSDIYTENALPRIMGEHPDDRNIFAGSEEAYSTLLPNQLTPMEEEADAVVQQVTVKVDELPIKWAAYEGVRMLVIGSLRTGRNRTGLTPQQRHSLLRYIRAGGKVIVMPSHDIESFQTPFWRDLLPVRLVGTRPLSGELESLEKQFGKKINFDKDRPPMLAESLPGTGDIIVKSGDDIILAKRNIGSGEVYFLAFTGGAIGDWSNGHQFMAKVIHAEPDAVPGLRWALPEYAEEIMGRSIGAEAPGRWMILLLLGGYSLLASAILLLFRKKGKAEMAWCILIGMAFAGAAVTFVIGQINAAKTGFIIGEIGVTPLQSGQSQGSATSFVGLFSPNNLETDINWSNPDTLASLHPSWSQAGTGGNLRVDQDNYFKFSKMRLNRMQLHTARATTLVNYGDGVEVKVELDEKGLAGSITNRSGQNLKDCMLLLNRRAVFLGDLADKESVGLSGKELSWEIRRPSFSRSEEEVRRDDILVELLRIPRKNGFSSDRKYEWPITFYGWCEKPQALLNIADEKPQHVAEQLLAVTAPAFKTAKQVTVPAGICGLELLRGDGGNRNAFGDSKMFMRTFDNIKLPQQTMIAGMRNQRGKKDIGKTAANSESRDTTTKQAEEKEHKPFGWVTCEGSARVNARFKLPAGLENLQIDSVRATVNIESSNESGKLYIRRPGTEDWDKVKSGEIKNSKWSGEIKEVKKYLGKNGEPPELRFTMNPGINANPATMQTWKINQFDMEITGRMP